MNWENIKAILTVAASGIGSILLLMLVAKLTGKVNIEEKEGKQPVYNMEAVIKGKRTLVEADPDQPGVSRTLYFLTFHKRDGLRVELQVPGEDYGLAAEGDEGILVWQGNEFIVFKRTS